MLQQNVNDILDQCPQSSDIVTLFVKSVFSCSEQRFQRNQTVAEIKHRLELITGKVQELKLENIVLSDDSKKLGFYSPVDYQTLFVTVSAANPDFNNVNAVEKIEMKDEEYNKRADSVRAFKRLHKMGRFAPQAESYDYKAEAEGINVGDRCVVVKEEGAMEKRATVMFCGETEFKKGWWVGVQYDEPLGKHDGSVNQKRYFTCQSPYGAFVRPNLVQVGDYPEEDLFLDDEEEF